jgi:hypothetical protein
MATRPNDIYSTDNPENITALYYRTGNIPFSIINYLPNLKTAVVVGAR